MVTVMTPTYNRGSLLVRLYESLKHQTDKRFEWIIVDDGSTDDTFLLASEWQKNENGFSIKVHRTTNRGKHNAINIGVDMASYEAFFIVDSDDWLKKNAIEFINTHFREVENLSEFAGISGMKISDEISDIPIFKDYVDATNLQRREYGLLGDKAEIYKTSLLKKYPFPYFEGENFLTEEVVWNQIANDGYKIRWFNKGIYVCNYLEDGLTAKGRQIFYENPKGWGLWIRNSRNYGIWDEKKIKTEEQEYIEFQNKYQTKRQLLENINISEVEYDGYLRILNDNRNSINEKIGSGSIALYGAGYYGGRIYNLIKLIDKEVEYFIDINKHSFGKIPIYHPDQILPEVDIVLITVKKDNDLIEGLLNKKYTKTKIIRMDKLGLNL